MLLTTVCYIEKDGKYLMLHRTKKNNDINQGKWIGVGGKIEEGESPEECVIREVKEETGLTLKNYTLRGLITYNFEENESEYMYIFTSNGFEGELTECQEGELAWIEKEKITTLNLWEGDKVFLEKIKNKSNFFTMKMKYNGDTLLECKVEEY